VIRNTSLSFPPPLAGRVGWWGSFSGPRSFVSIAACAAASRATGRESSSQWVIEVTSRMVARRVVVLTAASACLLIVADQATQRWAREALPKSNPYSSCTPGTCVHLLGSWLVLKRSVGHPWPLPAGLLLTYAPGVFIILVFVALIAALRFYRATPAVAVGLILGSSTSLLLSNIIRGRVDRFIAIGHGGTPDFILNVGDLALIRGGLILAIAAATGSVRPYRRRRPRPRPR
jgi:lipoprotein signal peptidase